LLDEKLVGFASGNLKFFKVNNDLSLSGIDPINMVVGVFDFRFNPFSVFSGGFSLFLVSIGSGLCVGDGSGSIDLVLSPGSIGFFLFLID